MEVLTLIIVGAVAGWLGSMIYKGSSLGFLGNLIVGIIGGFVGGWLFGQLGFSINKGLVDDIVFAAVGAIVILFLINLVTKKKDKLDFKKGCLDLNILFFYKLFREVYKIQSFCGSCYSSI